MKVARPGNTQNGKYKAVFEHSLQAIVITTPDGAIVECNKAACNLFGYPESELKQIRWQDIVDQHRPRLTDHPGFSSVTGAISEELTCIRRNGERFSCEYSTVPVTDNGEECKVSFFVDISDRRKQEERTIAALNEATAAKAKYKTILDSTSDGYLTINSNWQYTYINERGADILHGKTPADIMGRHIDDLFPDVHNHPIYLEFQKVMRTRVPSATDGYYGPWDVFFQTRIFPAPDGGIAVFFSDITEQRKADLQLQKSRREMEMILDNTDQLFMILDRDLNLVMQNQAYQKRMQLMVGKQMTDGESVFRFVTPENQAEVKEILTSVLAGNQAHRKFNSIDRQGDRHVVEASFIPITDSTGAVENIMIAARNITEEESAKQALHASEEKYRYLFYSNPTPFWAVDMQNGRFLDVNDAAIAHYGYSRKEFLELSFDAIIPAEQTEAFRPEKAAFRGHALIYRGRSVHVCKNGEIIKVELTAHGIQYGGKNAALVSATDITESLKKEEQLLYSELRFRSLIEKGGEIIALTDKTGTTIYISPSIKLILGYEAESRIGKKPFDYIHPDDLEKVKVKMALLVAEPNSCLRTQWRHKHANGSWRWMDGVATNLLEDPAVHAIVYNFRDITIQKQHEDALRVSNERFTLVARATQDSIWDWDLVSNSVIRDGKRLETLFGYPGWEPEEVDAHWNKLAHPEDWERVTRNRKLLLANPAESYWQDEYRFLRADGSYAYVHDCGYILRDERGNATRMIGASHDITARKQYEEALKEKNNELKRLSAYLQRVREDERKYIAREVHDELGQLASALKIDIDWLNLRLTTVEEVARKRIEHANKTIEILISSVRKIASSLRPSVLDDFGLNAALKWHCTEFQNLNGIQCMFESGFDDSEMNIHVKTELFRMAQESLTNVMRHAQASSVLVMTREDEDNFYLTVTDNGQGFDGRQHKNTLGLVGLRERAVSMNGHLEIESEPGKGTIISVHVPKERK
ncbi:MAG: PAS domain S-box protein [Chitinophagaceae bacterium]|nr:PAS domain S-box protein [Chitinophagaceae bacterium]